MDARTLAGLVVIILVALFFRLHQRLLLGAGATRRLSVVRWGVAGNILTAWVLTLPGAGVIAALSYRILHAIVRV